MLSLKSPIFPCRYEDECSQRSCTEKEFIALKKVSKGRLNPLVVSRSLGCMQAVISFPQSIAQNKYQQELVLRCA